MDDSMVCTLHCGEVPLVVAVPHVGTKLEPALRERLVPRAQLTEDADWFLDRLYGFVTDLGASLLVPRFSRYVVDLNRPPDNAPMYAGRNNTELCPTRFFTGEPLYRPGAAPDDAEVARRVQAYWMPYHRTLAGELERVRAVHGHVVLFDAHSIKGELPWLFDGALPDMNFGTVDATSCALSLREALTGVFRAHPRYSHVVDGRFKGGHTTRHYGRPAQGVHAVQLEMAWRAYMDESPPYRWHEAKAQAVTPLLRALVQRMIDWRPD